MRRLAIDRVWARRRAGLTLVELLMVMGLIAILVGAGMGFLSRIDLGGRAALGMVESAIRSARNTSLARRAPARVRLDPVAGELWAEVLEVVGTWHFEDSLAGAFGHAGVAAGAEIGDDGWIGQALYFPVAGATAEFPVQGDPSWDFEQGLALECALRVEGASEGRILDAGGLFGLDLGPRGELSGWFVPRAVDESGALHAGGRERVASPEGALEAGRWVLVRFEYDRSSALLALDGVEVARLDADAPLWRMQGPLVLGDPRRELELGIDALSVGARAAGAIVALPESARFGPGTPELIAFDAGGQLDRERHAAPVELDLELDDGRAARVHISRYGTVDAEILP